MISSGTSLTTVLEDVLARLERIEKALSESSGKCVCSVNIDTKEVTRAVLRHITDMSKTKGSAR